MSLITRCPACGTMFKVVTDQLKVSQGWVRCGQCTEVFNASVYLQPHPAVANALQQARQAPLVEENFQGEPDSVRQSSGSTSAFIEQSDPGSHAVPSNTVSAMAPDAGRQDDEFAVSEANALYQDVETNAQAQPEPATPERERFVEKTESNTAFDDSPPSVLQPLALGITPDDDESKALVSGDDASYRPDASDRVDRADESASEDVSFVRDARRKAFWQKPVVRLVLYLFVLVFAAALLLQIAFHNKDSLLAHEPRLKPLLLAMCEQLQCELAPLRQIDAMVIDSSSFNKLDSSSFRLSFTLKNTASSAVALPSLEVTLTDTQDQTLIRRVLMPSQFGASDNAALGAGQDFSGVVVLQVPGNTATSSDASTAESSSGSARMRVAGYRLLAFYP